MIQNGSVKLPKDNALPNGVIAPYAFVGDDAFALKNFIMKPYLQKNLTADKESIIIDIVEQEEHQRIFLACQQTGGKFSLQQ